MTVTVRIAGKVVHVSDSPPRAGGVESGGAYILKKNRIDPISVHQLRQMLAQEMGQAVLRFADNQIIDEVTKRLTAGRWSIVVVDTPRTSAQALGDSAGGGAGAKGAGAGAGGKGGSGSDALKSTKKTWVEVELLDKNKRPVKGLNVEVTCPDGKVEKGTLSDKGAYRVDGIDPGTCKVRFPELDGREWSKSGSFAEGSAVELLKGKPKIEAGPYTVKQGDHISSIAHDAGFLSYRTIWEDGKNSAIRTKRNPNVLYPGDVIEIPAHQKKEESVPTTEYHTFQTIGDPVQLRLVVLDWAGNPIVDTDVELNLDSGEKTKTAGDGSVKKNIDPAAKKEGTVKVKGFDMSLKLGYLDPVEEFSGQVWRLNNLGYRAGEPKDKSDEDFRSAVEEFQCDNGLQVDGKCGTNTQNKLKEIHGS